MKVSVFPQNVALAGQPIYKKFISSIQKTDTVVENKLDADVAVIWSVLWHGRMKPNQQVWNNYRKQQKPVIVLEVGGLVRNTTWRIGINGINANADFAHEHTTEQFDHGVKLVQWHTGDQILICGQHPYSEQWQDNLSVDDWFTQSVKIARTFDKEIIIRPHPRWPVDNKRYRWLGKIVPPKYTQSDDTDFDTACKNAHLTINYCSNPGIQSVINGVPVIVDKNSLAYDMSSTTTTLCYPDREQWLARLSNIEYTEEYIENDYAWRKIRSKLINSYL